MRMKVSRTVSDTGIGRAFKSPDRSGCGGEKCGRDPNPPTFQVGWLPSPIRPTTMTLTRSGLIVTLVLNGMLTLANAQHLFAEGRILAVGWQQGTVLLETHEGFSLVAVDPAAKIEDRLGTSISLADLQPGDVVEYRIEPF